VAPGENLFRISLRYGTTVDAIMEANGLTDHTIRVGQALVIPAGGEGASGTATAPTEPAAGYVVQPGDTLSAIALRHGVNVWTLIRENGLAGASLIYPGQTLRLPKIGAEVEAATPEATPEITPEARPEPAAAPVKPETYTVRSGDTLYSIARRFGTTAAALARLNGVSNPSAIYAGQVLRLTGGGTYPEPAPPGSGKRIVVNLSEQHLYAYEGERLVFSFVASSGRAPTYTRTGEFRVQSKIPNAYGSAWGFWMPWWLGIYYAGEAENGIHALPVFSSGETLWSGYLGTPISYGCIVLGTEEAKELYEWAEMGTPVSIHY
jgi:LysM repeat protein